MAETVTTVETDDAEEPVAPAGPAEDTDALPAIATWTAPAPTASGVVPLSARTGEPTRVWTIWVAAAAGFLATAAVAVSVVTVYLTAIVNFPRASTLMALVPTQIASLERVLLAVAVTVIAIVIGAACSITAYYAYDGRRWTRWAALIAVALSASALLLNVIAVLAIGLAAVMAVALWLPPSTRYFAAWQAARHHDPVFSEPFDDVYYGPLPRYRATTS